MAPRLNDQVDEVIVRKTPLFSGLDEAAAATLRASMNLVKLAKDRFSLERAMMAIISTSSLAEK